MEWKSWVIWILLAALLLYLIAIYNRLISLRNRFGNAFAQIDVQLKRRYELIPNLVETARAYMAHERGTLEAVIEARNQARTAAGKAASDPADAARMHSLGRAESELAGALGQFRLLVENYPELKADQTMQSLMEELSSTENRVAFARQSFNDAVMHFNTYREQFPNNLLAGFFKFKPAGFLELDEPAIRQPVKVGFG